MAPHAARALDFVNFRGGGGGFTGKRCLKNLYSNPYSGQNVWLFRKNPCDAMSVDLKQEKRLNFIMGINYGKSLDPNFLRRL
jgi:hypothetical protein